MSRKSQFGFVLPNSELQYQEILNPDYSLPSNPSCISSKISLAKIRVVFAETYTTRISAVKIPVKFDVKFTTGIATFKMIKVAFVTKLTPVPPKKKTVFSGWQKVQRLAARSGKIGGHHSYEGKCAWAIFVFISKLIAFFLVRL